MIKSFYITSDSFCLDFPDLCFERINRSIYLWDILIDKTMTIQGPRDRVLQPACSGKFWLGLSPDLKIRVGQFSRHLGNLWGNFLRFWRKMLDNVLWIRRKSKFEEKYQTIFFHFWSSQTTKKLLSHLEKPTSSIHMGCVDINDKCVSFLVSSKLEVLWSLVQHQ
jgi:hypothetical protein